MAIKIRANVKTRVVDLPIGITIPKTGELVKQVTIAGMDGNMEERISEKKVRNNGAKIITAMLGEKIVAVGETPYPKGIGVLMARNMWTADRDTCLLRMREMMADDMAVKPKCPECGEVDEDIVHMSQIEVNQWDPENPPEGIEYDDVGVIMFELPDGLIVEDDDTGEEYICKVGRMKLTNGGMEENIAGTARENMGMANTNLLAASIIELEHIKMVDTYVVKNMTKRDRDYLSKLLSDANPGPKFIREHVCQNCGSRFNYVLKLPDFFTYGTNQ